MSGKSSLKFQIIMDRRAIFFIQNTINLEIYNKKYI